MNNEEIKLTEYLHNIIENNMSLRRENDRLWKQKLEYIDRINKTIKQIKKLQEKYFRNCVWGSNNDFIDLLEIIKGSDKE